MHWWCLLSGFLEKFLLFPFHMVLSPRDQGRRIKATRERVKIHSQLNSEGNTDMDFTKV